MRSCTIEHAILSAPGLRSVSEMNTEVAARLRAVGRIMSEKADVLIVTGLLLSGVALYAKWRVSLPFLAVSLPGSSLLVSLASLKRASSRISSRSSFVRCWKSKVRQMRSRTALVVRWASQGNRLQCKEVCRLPCSPPTHQQVQHPPCKSPFGHPSLWQRHSSADVGSRYMLISSGPRLEVEVAFEAVFVAPAKADVAAPFLVSAQPERAGHVSVYLCVCVCLCMETYICMQVCRYACMHARITAAMPLAPRRSRPHVARVPA